jgi:hypothetical protein
VKPRIEREQAPVASKPAKVAPTVEATKKPEPVVQKPDAKKPEAVAQKPEVKKPVPVAQEPKPATPKPKVAMIGKQPAAKPIGAIKKARLGSTKSVDMYARLTEHARITKRQSDEREAAQAAAREEQRTQGQVRMTSYARGKKPLAPDGMARLAESMRK